MNEKIIVWFRKDLRLSDNPALSHAIQSGTVLPLYIYDDTQPEWAMGEASQWWLHHSLISLQQDVQSCNAKLIIRRGSADKVLTDVVKETGASGVYWNRVYEPQAIARDTQLKASLKNSGLEVKSFNASLLIEPTQVATKQGTPFKVFTAYWKHCLQRLNAKLPEHKLPSDFSTDHEVDSLSVDDLQLLPSINWDAGFYRYWQPGEKAAQTALNEFMTDALAEYDCQRDIPSTFGTSRLSPHLCFGEISVTQIWNAIQALPAAKNEAEAVSRKRYLAELGWREFSHYLLFHFPQTVSQPMNAKFQMFDWQWQNSSAEAAEKLQRWQQGNTGCDMVDAGMRELWHTGWMHNRVRMVVASYLTKNLNIHWLEGAKWFWNTLVDADLAANTMGWQWVAGCGADAAPFFRIFNPDTQAERFDKNGEYRYQWLKNRPDCKPMVDLKQSRAEALSRYQLCKEKSAS